MARFLPFRQHGVIHPPNVIKRLEIKGVNRQKLRLFIGDSCLAPAKRRMLIVSRTSHCSKVQSWKRGFGGQFSIQGTIPRKTNRPNWNVNSLWKTLKKPSFWPTRLLWLKARSYKECLKYSRAKIQIIFRTLPGNKKKNIACIPPISNHMIKVGKGASNVWITKI